MKHKDSKKDFNIIIVGTGGQGQITLLQILAEAAFIQGYDVKTAELHGLSQRGGAVEVQVRFGKEIFSPLIFQGGADFVLSLEMHEALRALYYVSEKTQFLINKLFLSIPGQASLSEKEIINTIEKFTKKIKIVPASELCKKELGKEVLAGVYLIVLASFKGLIPLKPESLLAAIKKVIPAKYLELNLKTFNLAKN
jgi:indolepyruvate ferredoxin oxidoreductase beta subunit